MKHTRIAALALLGVATTAPAHPIRPEQPAGESAGDKHDGVAPSPAGPAAAPDK